MKTDKIHVNKTAEQPNGVEIEIVQPENPVDERMMVFTLRQLLQTAQREERLSFDLPEGFQVAHQRDGSFLVSGFRAGQETEKQQPGYYQPPAPLAIVGLRTVGNQFDMIHASVDPEQLKQKQQPAQTDAGSEEKK